MDSKLKNSSLPRTATLVDCQQSISSVQSLEQLRVYEHLEPLLLQEERKILGVVGYSSINNTNKNVEIFDVLDLHRCLVAVTEKIPASTVVLDNRAVTKNLYSNANANTTTTTISPYIQKAKHYLYHDSYFCWQAVYRVLLEHLTKLGSKTIIDWISRCSTVRSGDRFAIRCWKNQRIEPFPSSKSKSNSNNNKTPRFVARRGAGGLWRSFSK